MSTNKGCTHQAEPDVDDNDCDDERVNDVAPEWPSRLAVESAFDFLKNTALHRTTGDEMQSFLLRFENFFSREKLFDSKQTNMTDNSFSWT